MDERVSLYDVEKVKKNTARTGIPKCGGGIADRSELQYAEEDLVRTQTQALRRIIACCHRLEQLDTVRTRHQSCIVY